MLHDTQDGKDGEEKEAETYENVFEYLTSFPFSIPPFHSILGYPI